jgi:hypothetical protein
MFLHRFHKIWPLVLIMSQINPVNIFILNSINIHFNIISYLSLCPSSDLIPSDFQTKFLYMFLLSPMSHQFNPWFDYPSNIWCGVKMMKFLIVYFSASSYHFFLFLNTHFSISFPKILNLCFFLPEVTVSNSGSGPSILTAFPLFP